MLNLYDDILFSILEMFKRYDPIELDCDIPQDWPDASKNNMILRSDMAYELGGITKPLAALGSTIFSERRDLIQKNKSYLIGRDLMEISGENPYARVTFACVDGERMGTGDKLYDNIRQMENTRYRVNPKGYMLRVSSVQNRECVRVSREAIKQEISFSHVGKVFNDAFLKLPQIEKVMTFFITDPEFDYSELEKKLKLSEGVTVTIDHVFKDLTMDCGSCNLKEICDEVEGLRELHFSNRH
ncbi:MAG: carbon monoxide dehydrogenase [Lachnospiraceae bacterium]|jgi:CO dehydrogenase/acetyl-CoA synthase beta subunit|nr:carbon monoxide dehydrogenase [Lachnospiraceae bacterium]